MTRERLTDKRFKKARMAINVKPNILYQNGKEQRNGFFIYCTNKGKTCDSWWSNPSNDYFGDLQYLNDRGYRNLKTRLDVELFTKITRVAMHVAREEDVIYVLERKTDGKYVDTINMNYTNIYSDRFVYAFKAKSLLNFINSNCIDPNKHWFIESKIYYDKKDGLKHEVIAKY